MLAANVSNDRAGPFTIVYDHAAEPHWHVDRRSPTSSESGVGGWLSANRERYWHLIDRALTRLNPLEIKLARLTNPLASLSDYSDEEIAWSRKHLVY